ncbi:MAG: histidine phosphatase family protein, partial [Minisyncoccia bacterium]
AIADHFHKQIIPNVDLMERDFGSLQGNSWKEIEKITGMDTETLTKEEVYDYRPYGGESADDVKARILHFLASMKEKPYTRVVVVCHSGIISMMRHLFPNNAMSHISNASINEFEI